MDALAEAVVRNASPDELQGTDLPTEYTSAHLRVEDIDMFKGVADKDVRKSIRVGEVPTPELAPDEALVAVMASAINYNTVWSATFEPLPTFRFLKQYARLGGWDTRHDQPYHVLGSDASGVIVRTGSNVRNWNVGDSVVVSTAYVDDQHPATHADGMIGAGQRAWGFETNFGGLAHYAVVRASQLLPKAPHLTWEEAAASPLCAGTAYRMLISDRGARIKQGDVVLIWGAAGGLGSYAAQMVRNGGGVAVGVVGSERKAEAARALGCDVVIDRAEAGLETDPNASPDQVVTTGKRLGKIIRKEVGEDPSVVFEHVGQSTFGVSVFVAARGGTVVTCGSSTGYQHQFDNRYLWMNLKRIIGSHGANLQEQWEVNRLLSMGRIVPALTDLYRLEDVGEAGRLVQRNEHIGKVGVLCLAPEPGMGVTDPEGRARTGEERLTSMRSFAVESQL